MEEKEKIKSKWYQDLVRLIEEEKDEKALKLLEKMEALDGKENEEELKRIEKDIFSLETLPEIKDGLHRRFRTLWNRIDRSISNDFGMLIRYIRKKKGYSLADLEEMTNISKSYIYRLEKGERKAPSIKIIEKLAQALDIDINELLKAVNNDSEEVPSLESLLLAHQFTIKNKIATKEVKGKMVELLTKIHESNWDNNSKIKEMAEIVQIIDEYKQLLSSMEKEGR